MSALTAADQADRIFGLVFDGETEATITKEIEADRAIARAEGAAAERKRWREALASAGRCVGDETLPGLVMHSPIDRPNCGCAPLRALMAEGEEK